MRRIVSLQPRNGRRFPALLFLKASSLHVGAAAAAASLRVELVESYLSADEFDEAYAIARITPGTNLLAMYALLGHRLAGWQGAVVALMIGALIPAAITVLAVAACLAYAGDASTFDVLQGARAAALAVLVWSGFRLLTPQLAKHKLRGVLIGGGAAVVAILFDAQPVVLILAGALAGAVLLDRST